MLALAHRAVDDGHVSRQERAELHSMAALLSVPAAKVVEVIKHADVARTERMSAGLKDLPDDWSHGEPLRVGDRIAFTGCDEQQRDRLEKHANRLGVRVLGNMSRLTVMLITDGSFVGTKAEKASEIGTRLVHPDLFEKFLSHLQPALTIPTSDKPGAQPSAIRLQTFEVASTAGATPRGPASPSMIRVWALDNGHEVGIRGRLPAEIIAAYEASTASS